ncbi:MAG TPA: hypothetical protein QGF58_15955 [Myxococcota bacterium]|nr:hypothetical protein [Myxococcota bacterium]
MIFDVNDGSRPSQLELARRMVGELPAQGIEAERAFAEAVALSAVALEPFDFEILSKAAARMAEEPRMESPREEARRPWWRAWWLVPTLAAALAVLIFVIPRDYAGVKGDPDLDFVVLVDGELRPGTEGALLSEGDRLQFSYYAPGLSDLVLLSIDGDGVLSVYYPGEGDVPHPIIPGERHFLERSIQLDGASGPEVFVAVFGSGSVEEAAELVEEAYATGSHDAVGDLKDLPGVDTIRVEKAP